MKTSLNIERNPDIMAGKPVIKGTRITVELILSKLGAGISSDQILKEFPGLKTDDIRAAQKYASDYLADEETIFL